MLKRARPLAALLAVLAAVFAATQIGGSTPQSATGSVHPSGWGATPKGLAAPRPVSGVATAEMLDGIYVSDFNGLQPFAVAGYTAGSWPDYLGLRAAFPNAHAISIAVQARYHADCLDDEPGDATPAEAGPWVVADIKAGFPKPCVYSDLSQMAAVKASLQGSLGLNWRSRVFLWLAWYRFVPGLVQGYDAVQFTDRALGRNLDESTVTLPFLSIAQPPYVPPQPLPVCIHKRELASVCAAAKAKIASDLGAAASSQRALNGTNAVLARHGCRRPYRRPICRRAGRNAGVFHQRVVYFDSQAAAVRAAN